MAERADGGQDYDGKCCICHSDCLEDAQALAGLIEEHFPNVSGHSLDSQHRRRDRLAHGPGHRRGVLYGAGPRGVGDSPLGSSSFKD